MNANAVRVALVEDHDLLRALIADRLARDVDLEVVACVATAAAARETVVPGSADVALLDVGLPDGDGIALGIGLQRADPDLRVLLLSAQDALGPMVAASGAATSPWSFLSKRSALAPGELADAVRAVARGTVVIDPEQTKTDVPADGPLAGLSAMQVRVLRLVAQGLTNVATARALGASPKAVEAHLTAIYRALDVDTMHNPRVAAVLAYQRHTRRAGHTDGPVADAPRTRH